MDWTKDPFKQRKFTANEYFTLKLLSPLGDGAVGVTHHAQAEVMLESGEVVKETLVFKLAFTEQGKKKLKHEFDIYCRMSRADVKGIVDVHGLFFDAESSTLGLLMADGGESLRKRDLKHTGIYCDKVMGTLAEKWVYYTTHACIIRWRYISVSRKAFVEIIESIDKADITLHDIRAENLTVRSDGKVFVIDFDSAVYCSNFYTLEDQLSSLDEVFHHWP